MHRLTLQRFLLIAAMTLVVNLLLFAGLPNILPKTAIPTSIEQVRSVDFLREPPRSERTIREKMPEPTAPEPARVVPHKTATAIEKSIPQQVSMQLPSFDIDAPPVMNLGVPVPQPVESAASPLAISKEYYGMEDVDQPPVVTIKSRPVYPYRARRLNLEGEVDVTFLVDTQGRVSRITIVRATPTKVFDQSVLQAVASWRFDPGTVGGRPVNTWVTTTIAFRMDDL